MPLASRLALRRRFVNFFLLGAISRCQHSFCLSAHCAVKGCCPGARHQGKRHAARPPRPGPAVSRCEDARTICCRSRIKVCVQYLLLDAQAFGHGGSVPQGRLSPSQSPLPVGSVLSPIHWPGLPFSDVCHVLGENILAQHLTKLAVEHLQAGVMHELEEGRCTDEFREVRTVSMPRALVPDPARNWSHAQPCQGYVPLAPGSTTMSAMVVASRSWPDERKRRLGGRSFRWPHWSALGLPRPARATGRRPVSAPICAVLQP